MAALRFEAMPDSGTELHRLAHRTISVNVHTWQTDVRTVLNADGSGSVTISRDGVQTQRIDIKPEKSGIEPKA